ncbi:hypothetical protein D3C71_234560 [compost metagenome]
MKRLLGKTSDFIRRAKELGFIIRLDSWNTSGLQIWWFYKGDGDIKELKKVFTDEGIICVHHFRKEK